MTKAKSIFQKSNRLPRRAENALRGSQQLLQKTFASLREAVFIIDAETVRIMDCNPAASEIFGYSREEMLGQTTTFLHVDEAKLEKFREELRVAEEEKGFLDLPEFSMKRKNGKVFSTAHTVTPIEDDQGKRVSWVSVIRDISEAKKAEEALRESEERLRLAQKAANARAWDFDMVSGQIKWAKEFYSAYDLTNRIEPSYENWVGTIHREDRERIDKTIAQAVNEKREIDVEFRTILPDGRIRWMNAKGQTHYDEANRPVRMIGITHDITSRKQTEDALHRSEERFRKIFEEGPLGMAIVGPDYRLVKVNAMLCQMLGYTEQELTDLSFPQVTHPEDIDKEVQHFQRLLSGEIPFFNIEKRYLKKNGEILWGSLTASILRDETGRPLYLMGMVQDITERKQIEEALRTAHGELELKVQERTYDLIKRLKELNCLYTVSSLLNKEEGSLEGALEQAIRLIPSGWQFSEITCARIVYLGQEFETENCKETLWKQSSDIFSQGKRVGILEVCYLEEKPERDEGPFLKEERTLINALADQVGEFIGRRQMQESLRETNELLEGVFSSIDLQVAYLDKDFNFIRVNRAYAEASGRIPEYYAGKNHFALFPHEENEAIFRNVVETGEPYIVLEKPFSHEDHPERGVTYWDWSLYPVKEANGKVIGVVLSLVNVTARKRAQEALRQTEEMLHKVLNTLPVGVWVADKNGKLLMANPAAWQIWGGAMYVGIDRDHEYKGWWPDTGKRIEAEEWSMARAIRKGETSLNEVVEIESFDGQRKTILASAVPLRGPHQEIIGAIGVNADITERKEQERLLREQSRILEAFFTSTITPLVFLDREFNFVRVNQAYAQCCQRDIEEFNGRNHFEFYPHEENEAIFRQVVETKAPFEAVAKPFSFPDHPEWGTTYWDWTLTPLLDDRGVVEFLVFSLKDVTEEKRAEEALKASSVYTRSLIEVSLDPLVTISLDGKITDVNRATELVTGISRHDLIGSDFSDYFTDPEKAREGYERVFLKGSVRDYPLAIRHASGKVSDVLYNATVYRNEAGEIQGVFAAARDVTEQKITERERLRLVTAVEQTAEGVSVLDVDGTILYVNLAFENLHDLSRQEVLGEKYEDIVSIDVKAKEFEGRLQDTLSRGEIWNGHLTRKKPDGSTCELEIRISPVRDARGAVIHYVAVERDVTQEARLEERVRQWQKIEALGTLAGGIAHDINNILMPIMINTDLALLDVREGVLPSPNYLQMVQEAAARGQELVKQIVTFSRQREQMKRPVEIAPIIKEALKFLRATIPRNIEIRERVEDQSALALADPTQMHQVLMNLCSNAYHAMREKGGTLEVTLTKVEVDAPVAAQHMGLKPGPYLRLMVSDTGHGMDSEIRERAFDPFFTTKKPGEGTGMGLAVVHGIVKNHEGVITLESEVGAGTTVTIFLPEAKGGGGAEPASSGPIPRGKERILLIDDEEIQIRSIQSMLERLGYRVIGKKDAREALDLFRARPETFDLIITDQTMPFMTGDKLTKELLSIRPDIPVILTTGFSEIIDEEEAKALGVRDFAMKPLTVRDLAGRIRRALKK